MTLANRADQDQTPQNAASDQGLHCLLNLQGVKDSIKQSKIPVQHYFSHSTLRDKRLPGTVSALIIHNLIMVLLQHILINIFCGYSLELPRRGDSNGNIENILMSANLRRDIS